MLKKYEVEAMIKNVLLEMDGILSDKPNEDGTYDLYFADVFEDNEHNIIFTFDTYIEKKRLKQINIKLK